MVERRGHTHVRLTVRDSGEGFDVTQRVGPSGLGVISMQERARLVAAETEIRSELVEGTTMNMLAPVSENSREEGE